MVDSTAASAPIEPTDVIYMPHRRRLFHEWGSFEGQRTLTLHYGEKEVVFDEPEQIPFGEALLEHGRFIAEESTRWVATPRAWETARDMLETLVAEGILAVETPQRCPFTHAADEPQDAMSVVADEAPRRPALARTWTAEETPTLAREIFGVVTEIGHLESLLRAWQIPHPAQDLHGRQLGDENVFPTQLYVDTPTERRPCKYPGSRYQHTTQMNVTGLRLVQEGWSEAIAVLRSIKAAFLRRRPSPTDGLRIADLFAFASCVLTLPGYMMHRRDRPVRSGEFPTSIAALFRIIDGTRLASRVMLLTDDAAFRPGTVPTPDSFQFYCEKNLLFFNGSRGVCAGPPATIREFLGEVMRTEVSGDVTVPLPTPGVEALGDLDAAIDYGCAAFELELELDRFWIRQLEVARELHGSLVQAELEAGSPPARLAARLEAMLSRPGIIPFLDVPLEVSRRRVCESLEEVARTCRMLRRSNPVIDVETTPEDDDSHAKHLADLSGPVRAALSRALGQLTALERDAFTAAAKLQAEVNAILGRAAPATTFGPREAARQWPDASLRAALDEALGACAPVHADIPEARSMARAAIVDPPRAQSDRHFPVLRRMFARARFGLATAVRHVWGCSFDSDLEAAKALGTLMRSSGGWPQDERRVPTPLDVLVRLFLASGSLPSSVLRTTLRADECEALHETGLVDDRAGTVSSPFSVAPVDGLYLVTDNAATIGTGSSGDGGPNPLVMPGYLETYAFAQRTHRHPVERSLDLCTGSGVHALLGSRHADASVGSDISPRAIAFAEWNRRLNGVDRVQFHVSDGFSALGGARFDRITANPPYQPDSMHRAGENWWGAGPRGTAVIDRIVAGLPEHLTVDGELQMIGRFLSWNDGTFVDHIGRVLEPANGDFSIELDADEEPLSQIIAMYPSEHLTGLVRSEYGVLTITRRR